MTKGRTNILKNHLGLIQLVRHDSEKQGFDENAHPYTKNEENMEDAQSPEVAVVEELIEEAKQTKGAVAWMTRESHSGRIVYVCSFVWRLSWDCEIQTRDST